jgi:hypothetical protein
MEYWNIGILEGWNNGMMEYWYTLRNVGGRNEVDIPSSRGVSGFCLCSLFFPVFQSSSIPFFQ